MCCRISSSGAINNFPPTIFFSFSDCDLYYELTYNYFKANLFPIFQSDYSTRSFIRQNIESMTDLAILEKNCEHFCSESFSNWCRCLRVNFYEKLNGKTICLWPFHSYWVFLEHLHFLNATVTFFWTKFSIFSKTLFFFRKSAFHQILVWIFSRKNLHGEFKFEIDKFNSWMNRRKQIALRIFK